MRRRRLIPKNELLSFSRNVHLGKTVQNGENFNPIKESWKYYHENEMLGNKDKQDESLELRIVNEWHEKRRVVYSIDRVDEFHVCSMDCRHLGSIECIFPSKMLYGCLKSGLYHKCNQNADCRVTFTNSDSVIICIYSLREVGMVIQKNIYGLPEKSVGDYEYQDINECGDYESEDDNIKPEIIENKHHNNKKFLISEEESQQMNGDGNVCEIQGDENDFSEQKTKKGSKRTLLYISDVPINKRLKKRKCFNQDNNHVLYQDAVQIINDLLYNEAYRTNINKKRQSELHKTALNTVRRYYKYCKKAKVIPVLREVDEMYQQKINGKRLLRILQIDKAKQAKYALVCIKLWNFIINTPYFETNSSGFHFKHHVMGTLYLMNSGLRNTSGAFVIIPEDKYLYENLPPQSDLKDIGTSKHNQRLYQKNNITKGRNNIKYALNSAGDESCRTLAIEITECLKNQ